MREHCLFGVPPTHLVKILRLKRVSWFGDVWLNKDCQFVHGERCQKPIFGYLDRFFFASLFSLNKHEVISGEHFI